jgi:hypothetical protein
MGMFTLVVRWVSFSVVAGLIAQPAFAQESENHMKLEDTKEHKNATPGEDIDDVITNKQLRAESGSKSRWSIATAFAYSGGSVQKPLAEDRPNIAASTGIITKSLLDGSASVKYNIGSKDSLMAGVGMRWIAPFEKGGPSNYEGQRFDADNPYLTYQHIYKWSGIQSVFQMQAIGYTNTNLRNEGYVSSLSASQDNIYEIGKSGLSIGLSAWVQGGYYNKSGPLGDPNSETYMSDVREDQMDYGFGFDPVLEYEINDTFNLRTVTNLWNFEHVRSQSAFNTYNANRVNQSIGIGISVTRDIFVYPNVQFLPDNIRAELTNVGVNTDINIF